MPKELDQIIEEKARANVDWLKNQGMLRETPEAYEEALRYARAIKRDSELDKLSRNITNTSQFAGCNSICDISGVRGTVAGPNDFCKVVNDITGVLYFCQAPTAEKPDGSLRLCLNYHQTDWNKEGIEKVESGQLVVRS